MSETPGYGRLICARYAHESTGGLEILGENFNFEYQKDSIIQLSRLEST